MKSEDEKRTESGASAAKGAVVAILAVVVAFFTGFAIGHQIAKGAETAPVAEARSDVLTQAQTQALTDQLALAIMANSKDIAADILASAQNAGVAENALRVLGQRAQRAQAQPNRDRQARRDRPQREQPDPNRVYNVPAGNSYSRGPENAPVTIVEFTEFQCPYCHRNAGTLDRVIETYGDRVRHVFKANLLPSHTRAPLAHNAALAAGEQGKFWEMHDLIFANQRQMGREQYLAWAGELDLDLARFTTAMDDENRYRELLDAEAEDRNIIGRGGVPYSLVNGRLVRGAKPFEHYRELIDEELRRAGVEPPPQEAEGQ